tara:strand:+ start:2950 stop:3225 length:276 start_codon:yes stop_codon:yes gene_type:complete
MIKSSSELIAKFKMIESGIVPAFTGKDLTAMLSSLSDNEKRKAKRKFRKLWRKILKKNPDIEHLLVSEDINEPDVAIKRNRCVYVVRSFFD